MNKTQHTPTPWMITEDNEGILIESPISSTGYNQTYCITDIKNPDNEERNNAAFIVRAVNSHEALIKACKQAIYRLDEIEDEDKTLAEGQMEAILREAIAQAEGKGE